MKTKIFEVRDKATFVVVMAIEIDISKVSGQDAYLLKRAGFGETLIQLTSFNRCQSHYDCYEWGDRTYQVSHNYIQEKWSELKSGDVIDVEFILGETTGPKTSERLS